MRTTFLLSLIFAGAAFAGFEQWTNKDGKTAELELVKVIEKDGEKTGEFKMRNGKTVTLKVSDLSKEAAAKLEAWEPPVAKAEAKPSVFDDILDGNLVKLDGKAVKKTELAAKPAKYYMFYYTASWCGPCQQYTPHLVEFYNENKNENFEIVLISWDEDEGDMDGYAKDKKMPWPMLKLGKVEKFQKDFDHKVTGIPSLITCDQEGNIVSRSESPAELEKLVK